MAEKSLVFINGSLFFSLSLSLANNLHIFHYKIYGFHCEV